MNRSDLAFYLLGKKHGYNLKQMYQFVLENQYWNKKQIEEYQTEKMKIIIEHAFNNTKYYHELLVDLGLSPKSFHSLEDLKQLPILNKTIIKDNYDKLIAVDYEKYKPFFRSTGGTTGEPFSYYNDAASWAFNWATKIRTYEWGNYQFGKDYAAMLKGGSLARKPKQSLKSKLWYYAQNHKYYQITYLSDEVMDSFYDDMIKNRIKVIKGYPTVLATYANYLHITGKKLPLKGSFTTAEVLSKENKELFEMVFNTKHIDAYGCGDGMGGANQCGVSDQYHINIETSFMEIVNNNIDCKENEEGEILLTSFNDFAMPMIRYAPGDRAIKGDDNCICGRGLPTLRKIVGRESDNIKLSNGRVFNGLSLPLEAWSSKIEKFQIVEESQDYIVLKIIEKIKLNNKDISLIRDTMLENLGEGVEFKINIVEDIPLHSNGKFKYVISKVNNETKQ